MKDKENNIISLGHWRSEIDTPADFFGFVYCITNISNNRRYIGKKQCKTIIKYPPLKGKKRKRRIQKDTDWRLYCGSSESLLGDIESQGKESFDFKIILFCNSKSELAYYEAKTQFDNNVLLSEDFYNGIINIRLGRIKADTPTLTAVSL